MAKISRRLFFWGLIAVLFLLSFWLLKAILLPFVLGMAIAYFLHPFVDRLEVRGWKRIRATLFVLLLFFILLFGFFLLFFPIIYEQGVRLLHAVPAYFEAIYRCMIPWITKLQVLSGGTLPEEFSLVKAAQKTVAVTLSFLTRILGSGVAFVNFFGLLAITPWIAFFFLGNWPQIIHCIDGLIPREHLKTIRKLAREIDSILVSYVNGTILICTALALFYGSSLSFMGLSYGFTIGVTAGAVSFIPYVGALYGLAVSLLIAFFQFWPTWWYLAGVVAIFCLGQVLMDYVLVPKVHGNKLQLHPLWIIFGVFAGGALLGFIGMLIAIPVTAVIGVLLRFSLSQYNESHFYLKKEKK